MLHVLHYEDSICMKKLAFGTNLQIGCLWSWKYLSHIWFARAYPRFSYLRQVVGYTWFSYHLVFVDHGFFTKLQKVRLYLPSYFNRPLVVNKIGAPHMGVAIPGSPSRHPHHHTTHL